MERAGVEAGEVARAGGGPWSFEPGRVGRPCVHRERDQRHAQSATQGRPLRRHRIGARSDRTQVHRRLFRQAHGQTAVGTGRQVRRADHQAASQVDPRELDARHRRPPHRCHVRLRGALRLRHERQAAVEEGIRHARFGILHGARRAVGICELAGDSQRPRDPAGGRAEGFVRGGVRRAERQGTVAHARARTCRRGARRRSST